MANGIVDHAENYQNLIRRNNTYSNDTIDGHILMHAQQALTVLPITASLSSHHSLADCKNTTTSHYKFHPLQSPW